mgnify:CR=1 FL=1
MAYKRCLITTIKNLFDIHKIPADSAISIKNNIIICSRYGISIGQVKILCPSLQVGDIVKILLKGTYTSNKDSGYVGCFIYLDGDGIKVSGDIITVTQEILDGTLYLYNAANVETADKYPDSKGIYYNITITKDLNQSETIPYGYLPSYKSKLKIADVCQVVNLTVLSETKNGVTFTNNGNGTITVNGTATELTEFRLQNANFLKDHVYLLKGCPSGGMAGTYMFDTGAGIGNDIGNGTISKPTLFGERYVSIYVWGGTVCNNFVFKPQLFDLTEMYGAGHEPTTVVDFNKDFPTQLFNKDKFSTTTINGVTFTNNGNGTITVNGTATSRATYVVENVYTEIVGHKCLLRGCPLGGSTSTYVLHDSSWGVVDIGHGIIANITNRQIVIDVFAGVACENLIFKPELVDLTALGLDSTITSPEQFNPKVDYIPFVYDYAPKCWLTSYKHNLIATTKNLLSYSETPAGFAEADWENTNPRDLSEGVWYVATSANNYSIKSTVTDYRIERNLLYINVAQAAYGLSRAFKCNPGEVYNISVKGKGNIQLGVGFFDMSGNYLSYADRNASSLSFTTPTNCKWFWVNFAASQNNSKIYFRDIQLEKGSSPTDYVPNRYL